MDAEHYTTEKREFPKKKCGARDLAVFGSQVTDSIAGVLGATGSVGQRFILLLALHPHFELHAIGASERSAGKKYKDAVRWKQAIPFTERIGNLVVKKCTAEEFQDCDLVFSGLDSDVAGEIGMHPKASISARRVDVHRNGLPQIEPRRLLQRQKLPP
jgi:aspartate-semialdehyde dehydrogenase